MNPRIHSPLQTLKASLAFLKLYIGAQTLADIEAWNDAIDALETIINRLESG